MMILFPFLTSFRSILFVFAVYFFPFISATSTLSTILVFAPDSGSAYSATSGLAGYGIPFEIVIVPQAGITLPILNDTTTEGNYGGIIVMSEVGYAYSDGWHSALTTAQWQELYDYQTAFGVRMVRLNVYPAAAFGTTTAIPGAGCCNAGIEQLVSISNSSAFPTANLIPGATVSTEGLWHYPANIVDLSTTVEIAQFAPSDPFTTVTTAAVINSFPGRQQMVFFISFATDWSPTSNFLQHAYIHWISRGLFIGRRRVYLNTQVDDVHLATALYQPAGQTFRARAADMAAHAIWIKDLSSRLPAGSNYFPELGHNGNGDILTAIQANGSSCTPNTAISFTSIPPLTDLEFQKPLGTGSNIWPTTPSSFSWNLPCASLDLLASWFMVPKNRDVFAHVSHTFSHEYLNNATYSDANKEIVFNQAWLNQVGLAGAQKFSPHGLIPPSITGLHNGDVIQAWMDNGIVQVVGDNTRPVLTNQQNEFWPLISTVADNGYTGLTIIPRWATTIYYDCDLPSCTTAEWINTSGGSGDFSALLLDATATNTRHLLGLHHDAFMFHQANMRQADVPSTTVGDQTGQFSLLQIWVETITQEITRLTTWPILSLKHDDLGAAFTNRMALDQCNPNLSYILSPDGTTITGVSVTATGNNCTVPIPVTFPVNACTSSPGTTSEQIGSDPLTIWTPLSGSPVNFTLSTPIAI